MPSLSPYWRPSDLRNDPKGTQNARFWTSFPPAALKVRAYIGGSCVFGPGRCQAPAQVVEYLPRLRRRIPRPDQFTALVLRDRVAHHHQPALAADHLTVAAPGGYPAGSYHVLQHGHQHVSFRRRTPAPHLATGSPGITRRRRNQIGKMLTWLSLRAVAGHPTMSL